MCGAYVEAFSLLSCRSQVRELFDAADTDGDGLIDFEEFVSLLQMDPTDQLDAYEWRVSRPSVQASEEVVVEA